MATKYVDIQTGKEYPQLLGLLLRYWRARKGKGLLEALFNVSKEKYLERKDMSKEEYSRIMRTNTQADDELAKSSSPSFYEFSFLRKMIEGEFENMTENSFSRNIDKRLFLKFNPLSKIQKEAEYKRIEGEITNFALGK